MVSDSAVKSSWINRGLLIVPLLCIGLLFVEKAEAQDTAPITGKIIFIPEPTAWRAILGGYQLDQQATVD